MTTSIRNGIRSLIATLSPPNPPAGQRSLYPSGNVGWFDRDSTGSEKWIGPSFRMTMAQRVNNSLGLSLTDGLVVQETDTLNQLWYDASTSAWRYFGNRALAASATVRTGLTPLYNGLKVYQTDTGVEYNYQGGSWTQVSPATGPTVLTYLEQTNNAGPYTDTTPHDVTGLAATVTVGSRPIRVRAILNLKHAAAGSGDTNMTVYILQDGVVVQSGFTADDGIGIFSVPAERSGLTPAPGPHTYKVQIAAGNAAAGVQALATTAAPVGVGFLLVEETA